MEYLRPSTYNNETKTAFKPISHFKHKLRVPLQTYLHQVSPIRIGKYQLPVGLDEDEFRN